MERIFFIVAGISVSVSMIVIILMILSPAVNERYTAKWRYVIWLVLSVRLLLPVDFGITAPPLEMKFPDREIAYSINQVQNREPQVLYHTPGISQAGTEAEGPQSKNEDPLSANDNGTLSTGENVNQLMGKNVNRKITVSNIMSTIYLIGILSFLLWRLGMYWSFRHSAKRWYRKTADEQILHTFEELKKSMEIQKSIHILICRKISSPMIVGLRKPVLLLPHEEYEKADLEVIIRHELIHFRKNDLWFKMVLLCVNAVHWFNPVIYLMTKAANRDIEISCDEEALKDADDDMRKRYSERILELMQMDDYHGPLISTNFHGGKEMMKMRIHHIFDKKKKKKGILSLSTVLILTLIFSACRFEIVQGIWKMPLLSRSTDAYEADESGNRKLQMEDFSITVPMDLDGDGKEERSFSLLVSEEGRNARLRYEEQHVRTNEKQVLKDAEPGVDYGLQIINLEGTDSVSLLVSVDYRGMPFGAGYWELYTWQNNYFQQIDLSPLENSTKIEIIDPQDIQNRNDTTLQNRTFTYLYDQEQYPKDYPVAAIGFQKFPDGEKEESEEYILAPLTSYDVEGYQTWGQEAINKTLTRITFLEGDDEELQHSFTVNPELGVLKTEEFVYVTLPDITATIISYYQYENGKWTKVECMVQ
jgi:beta-lactamase regulating signal transducer with metallopeptidase domain